MGRDALCFRDTEAERAGGNRGRHYRLLPRQPRAFQGAANGCVRPVAQDLDRQDPEIRAARAGEGGCVVTGLPDFSVEGRVALVTGASSGIGLHLAQVLALAGAKVALGARRADPLEAACAAIRERGGRGLPVALDVTDRKSIIAALEATEAGIGPLSILVNNAGVVVSKPFFEHTE